MPVNGPGGPGAIANRNRFGSPEKELGGIPDDANPTQLKNLLENNWSEIMDGGMIAKKEAAWLQALADHPNADTSVREAILAKVEGAPTSDSTAAAGFDEFIQDLRGPRDPANPAPPDAPVDGPTGPARPDPGVIGVDTDPTPAPTAPVGGGNTVIDIRTGGTGGAQAAESTKPIAATIPADLMGTVVFNPDDPDKGISLDAAKNLTTGDTNFLNKPSDLFSGALTLNLAQMLPDDPRLAPLKAALDKGFVVRTTNAQYQLDETGKVGNNVLFYGDDHAELKELLHHPDFKGKGRFVKFMTHWAQTHWEGGPKEAFEHERAVMSATHGGAIVAVTDEAGNKDLGWVDWPTDYGRLRNSEYAANLGFFSLDNMEFEKPLPANFGEISKSLYDTMDTMAALQMIAIPFASSDPRPWNTQYKFNLLEFTDSEKMTEDTNLLSDPGNPDNIEKLKMWSHYCMEGVWNNCNYVEQPINQASVDRGILSQDALDKFKKMETIFKDAGGLEEGQAKKGWQALLDAGLINDKQMDVLESTHMVHVPFKLSHPDARPISDYDPVGEINSGSGKGLTAKPLTLAGLVGGMIEVNFPREEIAEQSSARLMEALDAAPDAASKGAVIGGAFAVMQGTVEKLEAEMQLSIDLNLNPMNPADHPKIVKMFGACMAANLQVGVLTNDDVMAKAKGAVAYEHMDAASQGKVDKLIGAYARTIADFTQTRPQLDKALRAMDTKAENTDVTYNPPIDRTGDMMVFVPPQYGWLAYNDAGGAKWPGLVPVADAMHKDNQVAQD
jgi:hypothetical protein